MIEELEKSIKNRLEIVQNNIKKAANRSGRDDSDIHLIVVTKSQTLQLTQAAINCGIMNLGENYAEEGVEKMLKLTIPTKVMWHMIGHIQSRKSSLVARYFDMVHSLDSVRLARKLNQELEKNAKELPVLLEMNIAGEEGKSGWKCQDVTSWHKIVDEIEQILESKRLRVMGLMSMPPIGEKPEDSRQYFQRLRKFQIFLVERVPQCDWSQLSMGTSWDYEIAVEEGATHIRVGQAILGTRAKRRRNNDHHTH